MFLNAFSSCTWWKMRVVFFFFASTAYFNLSLILQRGATFLTLSGHTSEPENGFVENLFSWCCVTLRPLWSCVVIHASSLLLSSPISSAKSCHYAPAVTELCCNKPDVSNIHYAVAHCCYACPPPSFTQVGVYQQLKAGSHITQQVSRVSHSVRNVSSTNKSRGVANVVRSVPSRHCIWRWWSSVRSQIKMQIHMVYGEQGDHL